MTAAPQLRVAAVLHADGKAAARSAAALGAFLRDGLLLTGDAPPEAVAHVFHSEAGRERAIALAPARAVRLDAAPRLRPDLLVAALTAERASGGPDLYVFPDGPLGAELAARLAARTGGSVLTGVRRASVRDGVLSCTRPTHASHLMGTVDLTARPWCVTLDAAWADEGFEPPDEHEIVAETAAAPEDVSAPALLDVEKLDPPRTADLETARFLVVAGRGVGSRAGVERAAAAAARMGAAFGVTRPVAMAAWAAPDRQVGVSGTRTAPVVCVVAGASGAPAFLWGVERAGFIAAVDTDEHAPIAAEADAVVVDDAVSVLEALADVVAGQRGGPHEDR